nr:putative DNA primase TraC [uncultured bacterium]
MKKEYAEEVAARIVEQLEQGTAPWQKPWQPGELRLPYNPTTGKEYKGMNSMWLSMQGHADPRWMTYNQASAEGGQVRKGSKGTHIVYWKFSEERKLTDEQGRPVIDPETGKQKTINVQLERPRSFMAVVFNAGQIDGLPPLEARPMMPEPERHARAEAILSNSGANIQHVPGDRAYYRPSTDSITLPERNQFPAADAYYATALHELGHWTGHPSRLDRDLSHPFGSEGYAREELRAEIASLMLGERLDIGHDPGQHAAYVGSWIKALKEDPKEIFRAAADAERIAGYVMGFEQEQEQVQTQTVERQPVPEVAPEVMAALQEQHANAVDGRSPLESWQMMKQTAERNGYTAKIDFAANPGEIVPGGASFEYDITYRDRQGGPTGILTRLGKDSRLMTEIDGQSLTIVINNNEKAQPAALENAIAQHEKALGQTAGQELPQAQGAPVPVAWRYAACEEFDKEMAVRMGDPNYSRAQRLAHALNEYEEMGFEPSPREQAILAEQKPAMDEAAQWIHQNVLLNPVVKERVYETVRDLGRYTGDARDDKERREYLAEMEGKQRAQQTQQEQQAYTVHSRRTVPENAAQHAGQQAVYVQLDDGRRAWGFGDTDTAAEQSAVSRAQRVGLDAERTPSRPVLHDQPEKPMAERTYLAVPFAEKNEAKALGAKWDKDAKSWYAPEGVDVATSGLARWRVDNANVVNSSEPKPPIDQFYDALRDAGLVVKSGDVPTSGDQVGKIQRVPVVGDKAGATSGAYAYHMEGKTPGGYIQNYKTGEVVHWKPDGKTPELTANERAKLANEARERKQERDTTTAAKYEATATAAQALWKASPAATADNAYCKAKGITNPVGLRTVPDTVSPELAALGIKVAKTAKEAKALREADPANRVFKSGDLLIPGMDGNGKLWTLQSVNPYFKSLMKGGKKAGMFTVAGADDPAKALANKDASPLVLAEGYATADTVSRLMGGKPVFVAFDSGNLDAVARELRERSPSRPLLIAADNDHNAPKTLDEKGRPKANVGLVKATEAAEQNGGGVMAPQFKDGDKGSDWNDVAAAQGDDAARRMLNEQMAVAKRDAAITAERLTTLARTRDMEARNDPTTSADDAAVSMERGHAAEVMAGAQAMLGEVRSMAADSKTTGTKGAGRSAASVKAAVSHKVEAMHDKAKEERQEVLNHAQTDSTAGVSWKRLPEQVKQQMIADVQSGKEVALPKDAPAKLKQQAGIEPTPAQRPRSRGMDAGL